MTNAFVSTVFSLSSPSLLFLLLLFSCGTLPGVSALGCECTGDSFVVDGVSLGTRCAEWGSKNEICAAQTTVTDECCKPWCWVSEVDCPSARYNKEANKHYSYDACGATCANDICGDEKMYLDTHGNIVCESEYNKNMWIRYRMSTWIFIIPMFCLFSSLMHQRQRRRQLMYLHNQNQFGNGGGAQAWRGQNIGLQNNFTTSQGQPIYIVGANGRLTPLQNSNATNSNQPQFYQGGNMAQELRRQQNQPRSGGMLDALFGRANRAGGGAQSQPQQEQQQQRSSVTPAVPEMAPVGREPAYAPPPNYYGNENQSRRNQAVTEQQTYPTV